ncbi:LAME_0F15434g1_1 [Lachancea meyersii CBS 8951]|uniref:1,3-beta-glucanosyltransferase n=1 Tax=Lachancea meyersii CBS 8951 TaxID=1266667 RepID=A0A1G4JYF0_9SACH|nr:LAME_0F15434g1_1 [Lachancea meyersii CBS 8951]
MPLITLRIYLALLAVCGVRLARASINPVEIHEQHFYDSVTREPFFIKGVDYQPGGSSGVSGQRDPLSDAKICARDIFLFQKLGINTIRVYSITPDLNHDECMTMMAAAGIYLILDVNSPMENQHLNRYEPWTTYNEDYLEHVFRVVEQFGHYNNTLGFFAGNEIINDGQSARRTPPYIRAVVGDIKQYIKANSPRTIPVGYSAADDLRYRIPLSRYLECHDADHPDSSIDFYGVNSYQWCGQQTFQTSGYDQLVDAYKEYTKPVFFSEFGCNIHRPRSFEEVEALYSEQMINTFSGGLVYEFTEEPNEYGLVKMNDDGSARVLQDFVNLQGRFSAIESKEFKMIRKNAMSLMATAPLPTCKDSYENLQIDATVPNDVLTSGLKNGVRQERGKYLNIKDSDITSEFEVYDENGKPFSSPRRFAIVNKIEGTAEPSGKQNDQPEKTETSPDGSSKPNGDENEDVKKSNAVSLTSPKFASAIGWAFARF